MLNYFLKLKRKKGFTLVELIIVVAILGVLMGSIAALSGPIRKMINRTSSSADAVSANTVIGNYIENRLGFASKIEVYCAIDSISAAGATTVNTSFSNMVGRLGITGNEKDKAGILIFHYEADTVEPEKSHYELYDVPLRDPDNPSTCYSSYNAAAIDGTALNDDHAVFADSFYDFSQNIVVFPTEVNKNKVRNDVYMSVDIIPYDFNHELLTYDGSTIDTTIKQYIAPTTVSDYYAYKFNRDAEIAAGGTITYTDETCTLGDLDNFRAGPKETITFELQNIMTTSASDPSADLSTRFMVTNCASGASSSIMGSDIIVFYYIPRYK